LHLAVKEIVMQRDLKAEAQQIFEAGLKAVDPKEAVKRFVALKGNILQIGEKELDLNEFSHVWAIGAGKGSAAMAQAVEEILGNLVKGGLVIVKYGYLAPLQKIRLEEAGHPTPDENGWRATRELADLLAKMGRKDLVLFLLSGGGSALLPMPVEGITLAEKMATTNLLLKSGASIEEMNTIRKHLSQIKGGQLARLANPATLVSLVLSDVVGDPLDVIASGPTVGDPSTFQDCRAVLDRYSLREKLPPSVRSYLQAGIKGEVPETPKPNDPIFSNSYTTLVGNNLQALKAAADKAQMLGYHTLILSSMIEGDTTEAAGFHSALLKEIVRSGHPVGPPACLISGGETTVVVRGKGKGGRNLEFSLAAALDLEGLTGVCLLSGGTDGTDGPTDAAGAVVDGNTVTRALAKGLNPRKFLEENDSYHFFQHLEDLLITGPTNTNVMDLRVMLVSAHAKTEVFGLAP
jgi:glycerate 2-kinase